MFPGIYTYAICSGDSFIRKLKLSYFILHHRFQCLYEENCHLPLPAGVVAVVASCQSIQRENRSADEIYYVSCTRRFVEPRYFKNVSGGNVVPNLETDSNSDSTKMLLNQDGLPVGLQLPSLFNIRCATPRGMTEALLPVFKELKLQHSDCGILGSSTVQPLLVFERSASIFKLQSDPEDLNVKSHRRDDEESYKLLHPVSVMVD